MLRAASIALLVLAFTAPPATAQDVAFSEDFEDGLDGWTVLGLGASVACEDDCALRLSAPCCEPVTTTRAWREVDVPLAGTLAFELSFRRELARADTDVNAVLGFDDGSQVILHLTEYTNGWVALVTPEAEDRAFAAYEGTGWSRLRVLVDGATHQAQAQILDDEGEPRAVSVPLPFSPDAGAIARVGFDLYVWSDLEPTWFEADDLSIATTQRCFSPMARIDAPWYAEPGELIAFHLRGGLGCGGEQGAWEVAFDDVPTLSGAGTPPPFVRHAFASEGAHYVTLTIDAPGLAEPLVAGAEVWVFDFDGGWTTQEETGYIDRLAPFGLGEEEVRVALDQVARGDESLQVVTDKPMPALHAVFYDAQGARTADQPCSSAVRTISFCAVPVGAASVGLRGVAIDTTWTLRYSYESGA